jgi:hypothetical protein
LRTTANALDLASPVSLLEGERPGIVSISAFVLIFTCRRFFPLSCDSAFLPLEPGIAVDCVSAERVASKDPLSEPGFFVDGAGKYVNRASTTCSFSISNAKDL